MGLNLTADYHTHTPYSHGKNTVLENTEAAKAQGLSAIGITDHGFNHLLFGLKRKKLPDLRREVEEAKKLTGVNVLMGMESNIISRDGKTDMKSDDLQYFDIYLCGVHVLLKYSSFSDMYNIMVKNYLCYKFNRTPSEELVKSTTKAYIEVIRNNPVDILTHINFKCFCDVVEVAKCCRDYGTYMEINTKKHHVTADELNAMAATGVRFVVDSDAHTADRVGDTKIADDLIAEAHFDTSLIDNIDGRTPTFRFEEYKRKNL